MRKCSAGITMAAGVSGTSTSDDSFGFSIFEDSSCDVTLRAESGHEEMVLFRYSATCDGLCYCSL